MVKGKNITFIDLTILYGLYLLSSGRGGVDEGDESIVAADVYIQSIGNKRHEQKEMTSPGARRFCNNKKRRKEKMNLIILSILSDWCDSAWNCTLKQGRRQNY